MSISSETGLSPFTICKPTGLFAKAIYSGRNFVYWSIAVLQLIDGSIWTIEMLMAQRISSKIIFSICAITAFTLATFMAVVWRNLNKFIDIFYHFERNVNINLLCSSLPPYLKMHRLIIKIHAILCFSCFFPLQIYSTFAIQFDSSLIVWKYIVLFVIRTMGLFIFYSFLGFLIQTFLYIQSCFLQVEHEIHTLNASNRELDIVSIRQIRYVYCIAIENTEMLNSFLFFLIGQQFILSFVATHSSLAALIANPNFIATVITFGNIMTFSLVIYHMIYINHLATRIYEQVYSFSFKTDSLKVSKEIQLLLTRIARADVGFTFLDIFVITPTCVTSLATISLTIALATPALVKFVRF
uniref:Gustatory receptor n=1 Tax=Tetranychus urticae TaxID=32264 RepID=T1KCM0_TETUR